MNHFIKNFIRFSRLHTVIGTTLSISTLYVLALSFSDYNNVQIGTWLFTLLSCLGANIYIVGLNQITDIEIDRINKPYLPLASGAFSMRLGYIIISISVLISLIIALTLGKYLALTVLLSLMLGTMYSLPPFRLKRFYFWAAFCIIAVRGLIVNTLLFIHFHSLINFKQDIPPVVWLLTATIFIYSIIIAWFKDIPDMEGDQQFNIKTLTLRWGAKNVFYVGNFLISAIYLSLMILPFYYNLDVHKTFFLAMHLFLLTVLWIVNSRVKLSSKTSFRLYYQFIWVLFFLEYITFAVGGVLG
ncbi:MAG: homogentisate phytyltransferase [Saprospiraceae bacterium]